MAEIVPVADLSAEAKAVVSDMCNRLATRFGVTLQGQHVTICWNDKRGRLCQVSMIVDSVDDGDDDLTIPVDDE